MDFVFSAFEAWNLTGLLILGVVFSAIGGGLLYDFIHWRKKAIRTMAKVYGIYSKTKREEDMTDEMPDEAFAKARDLVEKDKVKKDKEEVSSGCVIAFIACFLMIFVAIGLYTGYRYVNLCAIGIETQGQVVDYKISSDSDGTSYFPVVSFQDERGRTFRVESDMGSGSKFFEIGEEVPVLYDPSDPHYMAMGSLWRNILPPLAFLLFPFVLVGVIYFLAEHSGSREDTVTGVKKGKKNTSGAMYHTLLEFSSSRGEKIQTRFIWSANWIHYEIGQRLPILYKKSNPYAIRGVGYTQLVFGLFFFVPGLFFLGMAAREMFSSFATSLFVLLFIAIVCLHMFRSLKKKLKKGPRPPFFVSLKSDFLSGLKNEELSGGSLLTMPQYKQILKKQAKQTALMLPVVLVLAVGFLSGGWYLGKDMSVFLETSVSVPGEVISIESVHNNSGEGSRYTYYPVVAFTDFNGQPYRFRDSVGSNPSFWDIGDRLTVLYTPDRPETTARINRGIFNWIIPMALGGVGVLMLFWALKLYRGVQKRQRL